MKRFIVMILFVVLALPSLSFAHTKEELRKMIEETTKQVDEQSRRHDQQNRELMEQKKQLEDLKKQLNTVKTHSSAIYRKLGVDNRKAAVQAARDHQLL